MWTSERSFQVVVAAPGCREYHPHDEDTFPSDRIVEVKLQDEPEDGEPHYPCTPASIIGADETLSSTWTACPLVKHQQASLHSLIHKTVVKYLFDNNMGPDAESSLLMCPACRRQEALRQSAGRCGAAQWWVYIADA